MSVNQRAGMLSLVPMPLGPVVDDLVAEEEAFAAMVGELDDDAWARATPAAGWTVLDQVAHLAEGEELAALALTDSDAFGARLAVLLEDLDATRAAMEARGRDRSPAAVLARWDTARRATVDALRALDGGDRVMWITGPMSSVSFVTARLMETWAHGQDVADALGIERTASTRLRHIAHLGVSTRDFSFRNRDLDPPAAPVAVALGAPDGETWRWGPDDAADRVTGSALDFCLLVTQRRHLDDTDLRADGDGARRWLTIAQAFAGPPTDGRPPNR